MCVIVLRNFKKNILWSDNYGNRDHNRNLGKSYLGQGPGSQEHKTIFSKQVLGWSDDCYTQNGQNGQRVTEAQNCSWASQWQALLTASG